MTLRSGSFSSRAAAVGLLLLVATLVLVVIVAPTVSSLLENREDIGAKRALLGRLLVAAKPSPAESTGNAVDPRLYCGGSTDAVVLAAIQGSLQSIAVGERTPIRSAQPLPKVMRGSLEMVGLSIDVSGEPPAILKVIHGIEGMTPALFIQKATLRRQPVGAGVGEEQGNPLLEAQLEIYCALRPSPT